MSRKTILNLILIVFLLLAFPLLWLFNQRLNYRSFLTLNTKFSIDANSYKSSELSSAQFILNYFRENGVESKFDVDVKTPHDFKVLGRIIRTRQGEVEVYEYSSPQDADKRLSKMKEQNPKNQTTSNTYQYKNLLVYNKDNIEDVDLLLKELTNENNK